jgi:hypothetical protein
MKKLGIQIVVIDGGFVHVGECRYEGDFLIIEHCRNIRTWGTTKGLGELSSGPTDKTITDPCGIVVVPKERIIFFIKVTGGGW